ncbi:MAG: hypothetical protein WB392_12000 [Methanotrichaceae archaeon]
MKQLGSLVPILLLLGVGVTSGLATAELTASQQVQPQTATVGETAIVTLTITYNGDNSTQIMVDPLLPPGIVTDMPGTQTTSLNSGSSVPISYPIRALQSGNYQITSQISYTEERTTRRLNMLSEFTATGGSGPSTPGQSIPGASGSSMPAPLLPSDTPMPSDNHLNDNHLNDNHPNDNHPNDNHPSDNHPSNPPPMTPGPMPTTAPAAASSPDGSNSSSSMPS